MVNEPLAKNFHFFVCGIKLLAILHSTALINPLKFHQDWSSHLLVNKHHSTGFLTFSPLLAGLDKMRLCL